MAIIVIIIASTHGTVVCPVAALSAFVTIISVYVKQIGVEGGWDGCLRLRKLWWRWRVWDIRKDRVLTRLQQELLDPAVLLRRLILKLLLLPQIRLPLLVLLSVSAFEQPLEPKVHPDLPVFGNLLSVQWTLQFSLKHSIPDTLETKTVTAGHPAGLNHDIIANRTIFLHRRGVSFGSAPIF